MAFLIIQTLLLLLLLQFLEPCVAENSTYANPMLPGFYPDPSCIFVEELDQTFFCASSSFNAFPGIPIHASKDLRNWKLASKYGSDCSMVGGRMKGGKQLYCTHWIWPMS